MSKQFERGSLELYKIDEEKGKAVKFQTLQHLKADVDEETVKTIAKAIDQVSQHAMNYAVVVIRERHTIE